MKKWHIPLWLELVAAILMALLISNLATLILAERRLAEQAAEERLSTASERLAVIYGLLQRLPENERSALLSAASVKRERVSIGSIPRVAADAPRDSRAETRFRAAIAVPEFIEIRVAKRGAPDLALLGPRKRSGIERFSVAVALTDNHWLNAEFLWPENGSLLPGLAFSAGAASISLCAVALWLSARFTKPVAAIAAASRRMYESSLTPPIAESGPHLLRVTARSFNAMSKQIAALIDNQRNLLASISHDMRAPITSLRLKTEFILDAKLQQDMRRSLDDLQNLTEAAMEVSRHLLAEERRSTIELEALVNSLCDEFGGPGNKVEFHASSATRVTCRADEVKRAVRNLIENAVKYGDRTTVSIITHSNFADIVIEDVGPGLSEQDRERAFMPFVRLTQCHTQANQSGFGLGLTLARATARAHGGDVFLENRQPAGLRAIFRIALAD